MSVSGYSAQPASVTFHVYGNGLVSEKRGGEYLYHHYNNLGSTMKLTDSAGNVLASYTYGAYGELLDGDTALTSYLYNGRCGVSTDANGLYYMRQRYYSPEMKRFVNRDVVHGSMDAGQSLNRYSYVQGNPVSYTDPFGLSPLNGLFTGTGWVHGLLGWLGCVPGFLGVGANVLDAIIYGFVDHDYGMAALAGLSAVTGGAGSIARMAGAGTRLQRTAMYVAKASELVTNTAIAVRSGVGIATTGYGMY